MKTGRGINHRATMAAGVRFDPDVPTPKLDLAAEMMAGALRGRRPKTVTELAEACGLFPSTVRTVLRKRPCERHSLRFVIVGRRTINGGKGTQAKTYGLAEEYPDGARRGRRPERSKVTFADLAIAGAVCTPAELRVIAAREQGKGTRATARLLSLSESTVKTLFRRGMAKVTKAKEGR